MTIHRKRYRSRKVNKSAKLIINNPLGVQLLQKYLNLGADLALRCQHELRLQLLHNFRQREMPVAEFENDAARSFHANRALREEYDRSFSGSAPTASRGKLRNARIGKLSQASLNMFFRFHCHHPPISLRALVCSPAPQYQSEKPLAAATPVRRKRNRARRVGPKECHTCRVMPGSRSPAPPAWRHARTHT